MLWVMNPEKRSQNIENALVLAKNNIFVYLLTERFTIIHEIIYPFDLFLAAFKPLKEGLPI